MKLDEPPPLARGPLAAITLAKLLAHVAVLTRYGWFRDELYYVASTRHLDWGFVDHPPLSIALLAAVTGLAGDSLAAIRTVSALAGAGAVMLCGLLARELGGGRWAQALAALAALAAPNWLSTHHFYSMNALDHLLWVAAALQWTRCMKRGGDGRWVGLGVLLGLGLMNKLGALWLGAGLAAGTLASPRRRVLLGRGPWLAAAAAALLFLPHALWQAGHGWPTREFIHNATELKNARVAPWELLSQQMLEMGPAAVPIWATGFLWCLLARRGREWIGLGAAWAAVFAILAASGSSKASYLTPAMPLLLAPGAVALELGLARPALAWVRPALAALLLLMGAALAPFALPLLPPQSLARFARATGVQPPQSERQELGELPQHFADQFGWTELAQTVARVYRTLTPEDRARCVVFGQNYGEAGAVDVLGRRLGLPRAVSGHNSYWLWGPGDWDGQVMIVIGSNAEDNAEFFEEVVQAGVARGRYAMPYERDLPVFVCRRLREPVARMWPRVRRYI